LTELAKQGKLDGGPASVFSHVRFLGIDGPWAGQDAPWLLVNRLTEWLLKPILFRFKLPGHYPRGGLSVLNRTTTMDGIRNLKLPRSVETQLVTVLGGPNAQPGAAKKPQGLVSRLLSPLTGRFREPVDNWYSRELGPGELDRIWRFLKSGATNPNKLDSWEIAGLVRKQRAQNLLRALRYDGDYPKYEAELIAAARTARTAEEFAPHWDRLVGKIVETFEGQHTQFMWTDPRFMPWLREALSGPAG
jgi:hypothetical protein